MKILKIERWNDGTEDKIVVTVEGYPHAQPVFPANISEKDLKTQLAAWKVTQDENDVLNAAAKLAPAPMPVDISSLKTLEGKEI